MRSHGLLLPIHVFVLLFAIGAWFGVQPSYNPDLSYTVRSGILIAVAVYFVVAHGILTWGMAYAAGMLLMLVGTGDALLLILQYKMLDIPGIPPVIDQLGQLTSLAPDLGIDPGHYNSVPTFLAGMIPLGIALILTRRNILFKLFWLVCTLICLYAIILTFSRGALMAIAAGLLIGVIVLSKSLVAKFLGLLFLIVGIAVLALTSAGSEWIMGRAELYRNSLFVAGDYLYTGIGLGDTFPLVYSRYGLIIQVPFLGYAHNMYLSAWMGQGLLGFIGLLGMITMLALFVFRVRRASRPRRIFHGFWLGVVVSLIHGLVDSRHYIDTLWLMTHFFVMFGLAVAAGRLTLRDALQNEPETRVGYFPYRLAAVVAAVLVTVAIINQETLRAAWITNQGALAETRAELGEGLTSADRDNLNDSAREHYMEALEHDRYWPNASRRLGYLDVKTEQFDEAVPYLEMSYQLQPGNPATIKGLGLAYVWNGQIEDAVGMFSQLKDPQAMADELTVWGFWRASDEQAQPLLSAYAYETSAQMFPDESNVIVWRVVAEQYEAAGETSRAREWYQKVLEVEPDNEEALAALG